MRHMTETYDQNYQIKKSEIEETQELIETIGILKIGKAGSSKENIKPEMIKSMMV